MARGLIIVSLGPIFVHTAQPYGWASNPGPMRGREMEAWTRAVRESVPVFVFDSE